MESGLIRSQFGATSRRRPRHRIREERQCFSLKVYGSDACRLLTYFFHAPTEDCHHDGNSYLQHLDSSSTECITGHRYFICTPLTDYLDLPQCPVVKAHAKTIKRRKANHLRDDVILVTTIMSLMFVTHTLIAIVLFVI